MEDTLPTKTDIKSTGRRYSSVAEMLRGEQYNAEVVTEVRNLAEETRLTRQLSMLRAKAGLTQHQMGERMEVQRSQSAISKLEAGRDEDITLKDIRDYAKVLNERIGVQYGPRMNHVEAIKAHGLAMRDRMLALAKLAHEGEDIEKGVQAFFGEAFFNILDILSSCQQQMPNAKKLDFEFNITIGNTKVPTTLPQPASQSLAASH